MVPKSTFDERNHIPTNFRGNLGRLGIIIQKGRDKLEESQY